MDLHKNDLELIKRAVTTNAAILFVGAGFSSGATNRFGNSLPNGREFSQTLWKFLGYSSDYDESPLPQMYEAALKKRDRSSELRQLLNDTFSNSAVAEWYRNIAQIFWFRIYTTNIDDVTETVYAKAGIRQRLNVINGMQNDYRDRDQLLDRLQYIKLNGSVPCQPQEVTFSFRQYAARLTDNDVWYDQFVRDYATHVTIFIGTQLDEPLLWRAVETRGRRFPDAENRLRSFLVCPKISPVKVDNLKEFNVVPVQASGEEFLQYIVSAISPPPTLEEVLLRTNPELEGMLKILGGYVSDANKRHIQQFYTYFKPVSVPPKPPPVRRSFLLGAEPQWADIYNDLDAPRKFNAEINDLINKSFEDDETQVIAISGSAGSGKSTVLKRVALTASASGHPVYFTNCEELPALHDFKAAIELLPSRSLLVFDNVALAGAAIIAFVEAAQRSSIKQIFLIAGRTNRLLGLVDRLQELVDVQQRNIPDLSTEDINNILDLLERTHMLGRLANQPRPKQREIFTKFAHRQILVAMREATLGKDFDEIIRSEFLEIKPLEAQMLYLCASLVTAADFSISKQQLLACSDVSPAETLAYVQQNLRDVLIPVTSVSAGYFKARHRVIAELIVDDIAPRAMLRECYIRVLQALSHDMSFPAERHSATFRLYQRLISHTSIYKRFSFHLEEARKIYEALAPYLRRDYHFWLQYGSLELEYGELEHARNYIEQARAFEPSDRLVITTQAQLLYKRSCASSLIESAQALRDEAREILTKQMDQRPTDTVPFHITLVQEFAWIKHWLKSRKDLRVALEELRERANRIAKMHPSSRDIQQAARNINDAYLDLAKPS